VKRQRCPTCKRLERRSTQANARYWMLLHRISESIKPNGAAYSADTWHQWAKSKFLGCDEFRLPNGQTLTVPKSSADLDTAEFNEFQTAVEAWAAERDVFLEDMAA
jgi:hypothetical protein